MRQKDFLTLLLFAILFSSCGKNQNLIDSENTTLSFFKSVKEGNMDEMKRYYPKISTFSTYYKSDSTKIIESKFANDSLISVTATNYFTNGFGKQTTNEIKLYLIPDSLGSYKRISDSKGLTDHLGNKLYSFAVNTGCITKNDTTDVLKNLKYPEANELSYKYVLEKILDFKRDVRVVDWSWDTGYNGSASGKGIVKNSSTFDIPKVKYKVTFKDRKGNELTTDDGYVTYDVLRAGSSESFSFYTSYVGRRANKASIAVEFDEDMIKDYVLKADYNGDEFEKYKQQKTR